MEASRASGTGSNPVGSIFPILSMRSSVGHAQSDRDRPFPAEGDAPSRLVVVAPWVDQVLGAVGAIPVTEHGTPERLHRGNVERVDRDLDGLQGGRVSRDARLAGDRRNLPSQLKVALAEPVVLGRDRDQAYNHAI